MLLPQTKCTVCERSRNPELHMSGSGHPVRKAENWLKRRCVKDGKPCKFQYTAGIAVTGPAQ